MAPTTAARPPVPLPLLLLLSLSLSLSLSLPLSVSAATAPWIPINATFYGGVTGNGTFNGACAYGDTNRTGYGINTASVSGQVWANGAACGSCYEVQCLSIKSKYCLPNNPLVKVTVTNLCPAGDVRCALPKIHFTLAQPTFALLGKVIAGVLPVQVRKVACNKKVGGMVFSILKGSNEYYLEVLISNVGGGGDIAAVNIKFDNGKWQNMYRNYGAVWSVTGQSYLKKVMSFQVKSLTSGTILTATNVVPKTWMNGGKYQSTVNF